MASESMHGRGYVNNGDKIAANYLQSEFKELGLKKMAENYYQSFNFSINTFPEKINLIIDNKILVLGKDYIVTAGSPKFKGEYDVALADDLLTKKSKNYKKFLKQNFSNKVLVVNDTGQKTKELSDLLSNPVNAKCIVVLKDKLTLSMSQIVKEYPTVEILRSSVVQSPQKITLEMNNKFIPNYQSQNVIGFVEGSVHTDSFIVFSAHYDHLGQLGEDVYFPGANDNASGCAMLLNLAKYYAANKPKYSIAFIAFSAEEVGLLGSKYFTENPLIPLNKIKFVFNMDIMGTGEEGITVVNGTEFKKEFNKLKEINEANNFIKDVKMRGKAANSDHYYFSEKGVKSFFIYTMGGIKAYHDVYDRPETLPLNEFDNLFKLITAFSNYLQE